MSEKKVEEIIYPRTKYHKEKCMHGRRVNSAAEEAALGAGWVDSPAGFSDDYPLPLPKDGAAKVEQVPAPAPAPKVEEKKAEEPKDKKGSQNPEKKDKKGK